MKEYTVILLYPDYGTGQYGETWCGEGFGETVGQALSDAKQRCMDDNGWEDSEDTKYTEDLKPVAMFEGSHQDVCPR